ncbi:metal ABC transporter substrate-binding protein [Methanocella arvoryzae]|uniref:Predicted ABC-type transport system, periplasmic component n=1 Tax=Methanocella arvoryzae (strain DSM 22066 / NBRC 105507 / MRE50) TaxID=351160 RepID=Q0W5K8_METAR|nr:metal ABC transporter substrate-binding protein [Methanocella arvoryzae]CAJ36335.1 predicted ABC-type transport system, periplasmic component [Methanocella arvoryzae MRE50]
MIHWRLSSILLMVLLSISLIAPACSAQQADEMIAPVCSAQQADEKLKVVCTTSVLQDPVQFIGGEKVEAISVADPTMCPHLQADILPNRLQLNREFIRTADLFVAYGDNNDVSYNMPAVNDFMKANGYGNVTWVESAAPGAGWNTPEKSKALAAEVKGWLVAEDPANQDYYEQRYVEYVKTFDAAGPTAEEREQLGQTEVIVMFWQKDPVENWLGMKVVNFFAPEFVMNGTKTPAKLVDDINANPEKYRNVKYVIENMQSTELAKGVEEALKDKGINAKRVIFTNFPGSVPDTTTMADVLKYNKLLVLEQERTPAAAETTPAGAVAILAGLAAGSLAAAGKRRR